MVPDAAWHGYMQAQAAFRSRDYAQARTLYAASMAAYPGFLSPLYGLVSVAVRQDNLRQAAADIVRLFRLGFVPWHQEATTDVDLARLWAGTSNPHLNAEVQAAAAVWGETLKPGVFLLSRLSPPVQLAPEDGPLLLRPGQEVVSWNPRTGRYHQVTSEGGRVMAFLRAPSGEELLYVTAQKVRRQRGQLVAFQTVGVHWLRLRDMRLVSKRLGGPDAAWAKVALSFTKTGPQILGWDATGGGTALAVAAESWQSRPWPSKPTGGVVLTTRYTVPPARLEPTACGLRLQPITTAGVPTVKVGTKRGVAGALTSRYGLGLATLPLPEKPKSVQKF